MEHWLPLFYERLDTILDYLPTAPVVFDHLAKEAISERHDLIVEYYDARAAQAGSALKDAVPYKPVPPARMFLTPDEITAALPDRLSAEFSAFDAPGPAVERWCMPGRGQGAVSSASAPMPPSTSSRRPSTTSQACARRRAARFSSRAGRRARSTGSARSSPAQARQSQACLQPRRGGAARPGQAGLAVLPLESGFETTASWCLPSRISWATGSCGARRNGAKNSGLHCRSLVR